MTCPPRSVDARLWVGLLTVTSALATLALACATPFSSLAAIAGTRMPARAGAALMVLAWAVSQTIGFAVLGYPHDLTTLCWAFAMLTAALLSFGAARAGGRMVGTAGLAVRTAAAFVCGFLGYKACLLAWSLLLGGFHAAISPNWAVQQLVRESLFAAGLLLLHELLVATGVPAAGRERAA